MFQKSGFPTMRLLSAMLVTFGTTLCLARAATLPAPQDVAALTALEPASSAEYFRNSVGYNGHFENHYSVYATKFPQVKALLAAAGIRHVRVGMIFGPDRDRFVDLMKQLATADIYGDYVTSEDYTQSQIESYPALVSPSLEAYEAPNEPDKTSDPDWAAKCRAFQQDLYSWVKSNPQTASYPVIGPSVTGKFQELGDVSAFMDFANIHNYLDVYNPDTNGWGGKTPYGVYGSIRFNMNLVATTSGSKPIISTETGYGATVDGAMTNSNRPTLNYRAQMRYIPRLFFEQYNHGIARTYGYEFIDKGGQGTFDNFGIVRTDLTPKPAYTALKSILLALKDPGPTFQPSSLQMQLSGNVQNVQHTLLEKRNGTYVLAIWLEVRSWKPHGGGDIIVPDQAVHLLTGKAFARAEVSTLDEQGRMTARPIAWSGTGGTFAVSDKISLVTLSP